MSSRGRGFAGTIVTLNVQGTVNTKNGPQPAVNLTLAKKDGSTYDVNIFHGQLKVNSQNIEIIKTAEVGDYINVSYGMGAQGGEVVESVVVTKGGFKPKASTGSGRTYSRSNNDDGIVIGTCMKSVPDCLALAKLELNQDNVNLVLDMLVTAYVRRLDLGIREQVVDSEEVAEATDLFADTGG